MDYHIGWISRQVKGEQDMGCGTEQERSKEEGKAGCARSQRQVKLANRSSSGYWAGGRGARTDSVLAAAGSVLEERWLRVEGQAK